MNITTKFLVCECNDRILLIYECSDKNVSFMNVATENFRS